jgi:hypothetical protein
LRMVRYFSPLFIGAHVSTAPADPLFSVTYKSIAPAKFRNLLSCSKCR